MIGFRSERATGSLHCHIVTWSRAIEAAQHFWIHTNKLADLKIIYFYWIRGAIWIEPTARSSGSLSSPHIGACSSSILWNNSKSSIAKFIASNFYVIGPLYSQHELSRIPEFNVGDSIARSANWWKNTKFKCAAIAASHCRSPPANLQNLLTMTDLKKVF